MVNIEDLKRLQISEPLTIETGTYTAKLKDGTYRKYPFKPQQVRLVGGYNGKRKGCIFQLMPVDKFFDHEKSDRLHRIEIAYDDLDVAFGEAVAIDIRNYLNGKSDVFGALEKRTAEQLADDYSDNPAFAAF